MIFKTKIKRKGVVYIKKCNLNKYAAKVKCMFVPKIYVFNLFIDIDPRYRYKW